MREYVKYTELEYECETFKVYFLKRCEKMLFCKRFLFCIKPSFHIQNF